MCADTRPEPTDSSAFELDEEGHLLNADGWNEAIASRLAEQDGISLSEDHWWLIRFVRQHYEHYGMPPLMRVVIRQLRQQPGHADASSRTLYRLLPDGPIRLACRYAGLPKPESCI